MPDRWVFFDVDQTLCDFEAMMRRALTASITEIERRWPQLSGRYDDNDLIRIREEIAAGFSGPIPNVSVRRQMFATVLADVADEAEIDLITDHFLRIRYSDPIVFPDVRPALVALSGQARLGVISNGNSKLTSLGLDTHFEREFLAEEIGYAKPDPRLFAHVADEVGAEPSRLIMIGDSYVNDVEAPRSAGWRGIWLRRGEPAGGVDVIPTLAELGALLS